MASGGTNTAFTYDDWGRTASKTMSRHPTMDDYQLMDKLDDYTSDFPRRRKQVTATCFPLCVTGP